MSINQDIIAAMTPICERVYAVQLPDNPEWPAAFFEIDTDPEQTWVEGAGYDQHTVSVYILGRSLPVIITMLSQARVAAKNISGFLFEGESGDADYEDDPNVYGKYLTFVIRKRNDL